MGKYISYILGHRWYTLLISDHKVPSLLGSYENGDYLGSKIIVGMETLKVDHQTRQIKHSRLFSVFDSYVELYMYQKKFELNKRNFYEIILGDSPQKPHFDIDVELDENVPVEMGEKTMAALIESILVTLREHKVNIDLKKDLLVYTSHDSTKRSYHVVINNYCHSDHHQSKAFYEKVLLGIDEELRIFVDSSVYSSKQNFRLLGSQKIGSLRPKIFREDFKYKEEVIHHIYDHTTFDSIDHKGAELLKESLVSWVHTCEYLPSFLSDDERKSIYDFEECGDLSDAIVSQTSLLLEKEEEFPFKIRDVKGHIISLKRLRPSFCRMCKRRHEHENPYLLIVGTDIFFCCRRSSDKFLLGKISSDVLDSSDILEDCDEDDTEDMVLKLGGYVPPETSITPKSQTPSKPKQIKLKKPQKDAIELSGEVMHKPQKTIKDKQGYFMNLAGNGILESLMS